MGFLYKGQGVFSLNNTDNSVGSLFTVEDLIQILEIEESKKQEFVEALKQNKVLKNGLVDEINLYKHKLYKILKDNYSEIKTPISASFDECVLKAIFKLAFNDDKDLKIEQQVNISGKKRADFLITYRGEKKYVEFVGPEHFISVYGDEIKNPLERRELNLEYEMIIWPYWIKRCIKNARVIFNDKEKGEGALWTSKAYFSNFTIDNPSDTIIKLSHRFNAVEEDGIGSYYIKKDANGKQIEHKLINDVMKNHKYLYKFIPKGAGDDIKFWVPKLLWEYIK